MWMAATSLLRASPLPPISMQEELATPRKFTFTVLCKHFSLVPYCSGLAILPLSPSVSGTFVSSTLLQTLPHRVGLSGSIKRVNPLRVIPNGPRAPHTLKTWLSVPRMLL